MPVNPVPSLGAERGGPGAAAPAAVAWPGGEARYTGVGCVGGPADGTAGPGAAIANDAPHAGHADASNGTGSPHTRHGRANAARHCPQ